MVILASRSPDTSGILLQYVIFPFAPALSLVEKLANDSETILLLFMKYIMSGKINILERIILMLDEMKEEENVILQKILNLI